MAKAKEKLKEKLEEYRLTIKDTILRLTQINDRGEVAKRDESVVPLFLAQCSKLDSIYNEYLSTQKAIRGLIVQIEDANYEQDAKLALTIEDLYTQNLAAMRKFSISQGMGPEQSLLDTSLKNDQPTLGFMPSNLPKIVLPKFDGKIEHFPSFIDTYDALIHRNVHLSDLEKLVHLKSCLVSDAATIVSQYPTVADNYDLAYACLQKRYCNKRIIADHYMRTLLNAKSVTDKNSLKQLKTFCSTFEESVNALRKTLKSDLSEFILFSLAARNLNNDLRKQFEEHFAQISRDSGSFPTANDLFKFLQSQVKVLELTQGAKASSNTTNQEKSMGPTRKQILLTCPDSAKPIKCLYCEQNDHRIFTCSKFRNLSPKERSNFIQQKGYCFNCIGLHHTVKECRSTRKCFKCGNKHNSLLCTRSTTARPDKPDDNPTSETSDQNHITLASLSRAQTNLSTVLLATTSILIRSHSGKWSQARAVLDTGAQGSFITEAMAKKLGLQLLPKPGSVHGISKLKCCTLGEVKCEVASFVDKEFSLRISASVLPEITSFLPSYQIDPSIRKACLGLRLADESFDVPKKVDMLLGSEIFASALQGGKIILGEDGPVAVSTRFGYVLMGRASCFDKTEVQQIRKVLLTCCELDESLKQFWSLEEVSPTKKTCHPAEIHFAETHCRDEAGRYILRLPFLTGSELLGDSYQRAIRCFQYLENRLSKNPELRRKYVEFMREYEDLGHMVRLPEAPKSSPNYFMTHHGVFKKGSDKIRVVFNASSPTTTGLSLNDLLSSGPKIHPEIFNVLLKFRTFKIVFSCDIRHMYRQILIDERDRDFQLILWRESPEHPLSAYALSTVVYGVTSSPFMAMRTLRQLAADEGKDFPRAAYALKHETFVDDILSGGETEAETLEKIKEIQQLLERGGFELRKWKSSSDNLIAHMPESFKESPINLSGTSAGYKLLGLQWDRTTDSFFYSIHLQESDTLTKRAILSQLASMYDPHGYIAPLTFWGKCLIQKIWTLGLPWDEILPETITSSWTRFKEELKLLPAQKIPRHVPVVNSAVELHLFADASMAGYGACVYSRIKYESGYKTQLVASKTRVAPLRTVSIPRLELCAAHLGARLVGNIKKVFETWNINISDIIAWSDSTITLSWIRTPPHLLQVFVGNRVSEIQDLLPPASWYHVNSEENPADLLSRGAMPSQLVNNSLWWNGPQFLQQPGGWKPSFSPLTFEELPETRNQDRAGVSLIETEKCEFSTFCARFSSLGKLVRVTAYIFRFYENAKKKNSTKLTSMENVAPITSTEWSHSIRILCKMTQIEDFGDEMKLLRRGLQPSTRFRRLSAFFDNEDLVRVGGRLRNVRSVYNNPIILPKRHWFVNLLIDFYHVNSMHSGVNLVYNLMIKRFWIFSARSVIKSRIFKCLVCFRASPKPESPLMGDLPTERVTLIRPFHSTGIDFCGPFLLKSSPLRNAAKIKTYICVFICMSTKAVHLEHVLDLTTSAFIAALSRFVARRGCPQDLFSDMGTNFQGARNTLSELFRSRMKEDKNVVAAFTSPKGINFHMIPPSSPFFGGLWENAVKQTKRILNKVIGLQVLTLDEFATIVTQAEAVLNSRPICPASSDPTDFDVLTPGHFLIGHPLLALPEPDTTTENPNHLRRWALVQHIHQHFWRRWKSEYLHTLQSRAKWATKGHNVKEGQLVLIKDDNSKPLVWARGRVIRVIPGKDGVVRVAEVQTPNGNFLRPVRKLCCLPVDSS